MWKKHAETSIPFNIRPGFLICLFLVISTAAVYWPVKDFSFTNFDDNLYVSENRYVQKGLTVDNFIWSFTAATEITNYWAPLTWLSFLLDYELYGMNSGGYHVTNLLLHIINAILLFLILKQMTGKIWQSALVALLFALHPLHVESVAWITERKDVLSTLFWMLTLSSYAWYVRCPGIYRYVLVFICFILGLMAKPMLVTLPFVLLLLDYWPLNRFRFETHLSAETYRNIRWTSRNFGLLLEKVPFFIIITILSVATYLTQRAGGTVESLENIPLAVRISNALVSYIAYIGKMIWPSKLAPLYPHPDILPLWQSVISFLLLAGITFLCIRYWRKKPYLIVGWLWYVGIMVPVIGLVVIGPHAMADRYTYVSLIGIFIIIAWEIPEGVVRHRYGFVAICSLMSILIPILMITAWLQVQHWRNSITLFQHTLKVTSDNIIAHNNLGAALQEQGDYREAGIQYSKALQIKPGYADAHNNFGALLYKQGRFKEAFIHFSETLRIKPDDAKAHNNIGLVLYEQDKYQSAIEHFSKALQIDPYHVSAYNHLGITLHRQGNHKVAFDQFFKALQIEPDNPEVHYNIGTMLGEIGHFQGALHHFSEALRLRPDYKEALDNQRFVMEQMRKSEE